ncbi:thiamine phosphate synthase [Sulfitobacter donghicola]|uniref:Thiamine-phosphate pyrophosphorylase n=1 Tax=Sulfitobacter donghicola DSW-25 = KCTC 12864 = JCM 14565 TaxID=1300350 RepID=A0A073ISS0_9RHOB|nr:thiamine phosphate synthase [Sulfitobacter donghicola]KEJ88442.1 thiamine-phosphate pyrophosphorylase [Sulfitobacter donghicola DSW-25 = KCTC 12864 = JCM 14565]KIN69689.1 Thiamine-phosphate pyrophosphorylase [Sulfitobacter donghicola DSW-25 = KCTC 12864 = JCM 14565]
MQDAPEQPQLYLITPPALELESFPDVLASILDTHETACVRLALSTTDESELSRAADTLRVITDARDVALVIAEHVLLAERLGLDGVHLTDAARSVRHARTTLGADAIVGSFCAGSRHDGMSAGEAGADYISFGPVKETALGDGEVAEEDLFQWWSEVIEVPCVAEGHLDVEMIAKLAPKTDFFGIGNEIWGQDDPLAALTTLWSAIG